MPEGDRPSRWRRARATAYLVRHAVGEERFAYRSPDAIRRALERRIARQVDHAYRSVPFYREAMDRLGLRPAVLRTAADLARLPYVSPADLGRRPEAFLAADLRADNGITLRSSGSSGARRGVRYDAASLLEEAAHSRREWPVRAAAIGRPSGSREAVLTLPVSSLDRLRDWVLEQVWIPRRWKFERRILSMFDPVAETVRELNAFEPDVIHGYGSHLAEVFRHLEHFTFRPRAITYTSDDLPRAIVRRIEAAWGIPVLGAYRAVEAFAIGWQCGAGDWLHLNQDLYPVRIVDPEGREVPDGESGAVIVSNLVNRATVLLNYRLGDRAARLEGPCPCGRTLPRLTLPEGRDYDWIALPSGRRLHPQTICLVFRDDDVAGFQVVETAPGRFRAAVRAYEGRDPAALGRRLESGLRRSLGPGCSVELVFVPELPRSAAGKIRQFIAFGGAERTRGEEAMA